MYKLLGVLAAVAVAVLGLADGIYPVYYDCSYPPGGVESFTRLYLLNETNDGVHYSIVLYSFEGDELGSRNFFINPYATHSIALTELITGDRTFAWGLCLVLTHPGELKLIVERYQGGRLLGYETIPQDAVGNYHAFFYNASHSSGGPDNDTHLAIMNPTGNTSGYWIELYDAYGNRVGSASGTLDPWRTAVWHLADLISGPRDFTWGVCIVQAAQYAYELFAVNVFRLRDGAFISSETVP